jgi:hypothetical protein
MTGYKTDHDSLLAAKIREIFESVFKKQRLIYMKRIQFTLEFVLLLLAIPLLVFLQYRHDYRESTDEKAQAGSEVVFTKKLANSDDVLLLTNQEDSK